MPWRIRTQTVILSLVPLFFLCLLFALALVMVNRTLDVATWNQRSAQVITLNDLAIRSLSEMSPSVSAYTTSRKSVALAGYRAGIEALPPQLRQLRRLTADEPEQQRPVAAFTADMEAAMVVYRDYLRDVDRGQVAKAKAIGNDPKTRRLGPALLAASNDINTAQRKIALRLLDASRRSQQTFGVILLLCCLAGIVVTLGTSLAYGFRVVRRLHDLATNAQRMAAGQEPVPIGGSDEIYELNNVYLEMTRRVQQEHRIAATLQRALLPSDLPSIDGLRIDTAYTPATLETEVGGDWYDVFRLSESRVGISVGDVAGHGLKAAGIMGMTRQAIRTVAGIDADPGRVLALVNRALIRDERDCLVTAFFGILNLDDGTLRYSIAGHPAPMLVRANRTIEQIEATGLILGVDPTVEFATHSLRIEIGAGLVLYTDGIVELERDYLKGLRDLEAAVRFAYDGPEPNTAEAIQRRIFERSQPRDDSAVLIVRVLHLRSDAPAPVAWNLDTREANEARRVKGAVLEELKRVSVGIDFAYAELIVGELLGNVARHTPGIAEVTLEWCGGQAILHVVDRGQPFDLDAFEQPDMLAESGRGLYLVNRVSDGISVEQTPEGNRVTAILPILQT